MLTLAICGRIWLGYNTLHTIRLCHFIAKVTLLSLFWAGYKHKNENDYIKI